MIVIYPFNSKDLLESLGNICYNKNIIYKYDKIYMYIYSESILSKLFNYLIFHISLLTQLICIQNIYVTLFFFKYFHFHFIS
jgi:hypothetical protein